MKRTLAPRLLFWALVSLAPVLAWYATRAHPSLERSSGPRPPPPPVLNVDVLRGARTLSDGTVIEVELTRLHAESEQQAFDSAALARRLEFGPGEPWQLQIARTLAPNSGKASAVHWEGAALSIVDDRGPCALPPRAAARAENSSSVPADPLRTLLAPGAGTLAAGASTRVFLWGRAAESGARLTGLFPEALALASESLARRELGSALARLPAPKEAPPAASVEGAQR